MAGPDLYYDDKRSDSDLSPTINLRYLPVLPAWAFDNGWHNSVRMVYAQNYLPSIGGACTVAGNDCLAVVDTPGSPRDKVSLLIIAGQHDWSDDNTPGLHDDIVDVFDAENEDTIDQDFAIHEGNDEILVIEEL